MHEKNHPNRELCTALWSAIKGFHWSLHAMEKLGVEDAYRTELEARTESLQKFRNLWYLQQYLL